MCGICGFVAKESRETLQAMTRALAHRGPDGEGMAIWPEAGVHLGHRRLSVVDLAGGGQPMATADTEVIVTFNGEIYNHRDLRRELEQKGYRFQSDHSDTEVLLHGYREWGAALPERLNGMWAFALYDRPRQRLFLSRDRMGEKPLYYTAQERVFAFASELTPLLLHPEVTARVSALGLRKYFAYSFIPAPHTLYERIHKLPAGHNLTFDIKTGGLELGRYWEYQPDPFPVTTGNPEKAWCEALRELLGRSVEQRLMADVPIGIFLSGGIDSSAMVALATARKADPAPLLSFSMGFKDASFDESPFAARVAEQFGTDHHARIFDEGKMLDSMAEVMSAMDEPMGDSSNLATYLLCGLARQKVKVALGGDGGDELFAGYDPFRALFPAARYARLVSPGVHAWLRRQLERIPPSHANMSLRFKINRTFTGLSYPPSLWNPVWLGTLEPGELEDLFHTPLAQEELYSEALACWEGCAMDNLVDRTLHFYMNLFLPDRILTKVDRFSMRHGLEVRSPFLDRELVEFVRRIPWQYKLRGSTTKYLLKQALAPLLPSWVIHRRKKGFGTPIGQWFQNGMLTWPKIETMGMMDEGFIRARIQAHRCGQRDERLFLLNHWLLSVRR